MNPFILETDASDIHIAEIIMQLQQGNKVIISCTSRTLTCAEKNYGVVEREALTIVYGIKYFRPYLFGRPFLVISDHDCLNTFTTSKILWKNSKVDFITPRIQFQNCL